MTFSLDQYIGFSFRQNLRFSQNLSEAPAPRKSSSPLNFPMTPPYRYFFTLNRGLPTSLPVKITASLLHPVPPRDNRQGTISTYPSSFLSLSRSRALYDDPTCSVVLSRHRLHTNAIAVLVGAPGASAHVHKRGGLRAAICPLPVAPPLYESALCRALEPGSLRAQVQALYRPPTSSRERAQRSLSLSRRAVPSSFSSACAAHAPPRLLCAARAVRAPSELVFSPSTVHKRGTLFFPSLARSPAVLVYGSHSDDRQCRLTLTRLIPPSPPRLECRCASVSARFFAPPRSPVCAPHARTSLNGQSV